ncbi:hypothetical protein AB0B89_31070 [Sphaerisporangium sp. NPDC049002]|uniref:hypothetical protein n=1 Tax=Sphaerisporangium sp. NPDC049002 TaxID=3155392 RepID=UPI0033D3E57B
MNTKVTQTPTPARTISVEEVGDVPELADLPGLTLPWERVVVERHDGKFVRLHGAEFTNWVAQAGGVEAVARALVVKLASRAETSIDVEPEPVRTEPAYVLPSVPDVLRKLADRLDTLTCDRITPPDLYGALNRLTLTNNGFVLRQEALAALVDHWQGGTCDDRWLNGWTGPRRRVDIVSTIRNAATLVETRAAVTR